MEETAGADSATDSVPTTLMCAMDKLQRLGWGLGLGFKL